MTDRSAPRQHEHDELWEVLPWYVNRSLPDDELRRVELHIDGCDSCQTEVRFLHGIAHSLGQQETQTGLASGAFEHVWSQIEGSARGAPRTTTPGRQLPATAPPGTVLPATVLPATVLPATVPRRYGGRQLFAWAVAAQLVVLLGIGAFYLASRRAAPDPVRYRTLSSTPIEQGEGSVRVRLVFEPATTEAELRRILQESEARIVNGPSPFGVYTVAPLAGKSPDGEAFLEGLRSRVEVRFAEPLPSDPEARR